MILTDLFPSNWAHFIGQSEVSEILAAIESNIEEDFKSENICPEKKSIFAAFNVCPPEKVKVLILGQDPYPNPSHANGLAFSAHHSVFPLPRSLGNIYKEIASEYGEVMQHRNADLTKWAEQGVLLLNTVLTTQKSVSFAHKKVGWERLTDLVVHRIGAKGNKVGLFWGNHAQKKAELWNPKNNLILKSAHPSPLSARRGFFGCNHFREANAYLVDKKVVPIRW